MAAPTPREEYGYKAKIAKQAESYEEMVEFMEKVSAEANGEDLTVEERDLLLAAYENLLEATRASLRIISSIEQKVESRGDKDHVAIICDYRSKIESEFSNICDGMLELLDSRLIPFASSRDSKVFYLKVRRDYKRYLAEIKSGAEHKETADIALSHREKYLYMAKLAEQADRYHEMVEFIEKVLAAADSEDLMVEERNLLGVAYKRLIGVARASWRIISSMEDQEESLGNMHHVIINRDYRSKVESEVCNICDDILNLLDSRLIPLASTAGSKVFYFKMKGDYNRYLTEIKTGTQRKEIIETTLAAYKSGQDIANAELSPTHPFRLGLALNVSVFYYEILDSLDHALYLAKEAFDEAVAEMGTLDEESYEDSTFILQLLRDNLNLWNSQMQDDE